MVAILFLPFAVGAAIPTILFSVGFAIFTVVFQLTYTKALSLGNVSLTVTLVNLSMLFPVLLSAVFFKEPFSAFRGIGVFLTCVSFVFGVEIQSKNSVNKKWFWFALTAMLANAAIAIVQKFFGLSPCCEERAAFISWSYVFAALGTFLLFGAVSLKGNKGKITLNKSFYGYTIIIGCILGCFQLLNTYAIAMIDGTFLFPTYSGGSIVLSALLGVLCFRERLSRKQTASLLIGITAIILMNF